MTWNGADLQVECTGERHQRRKSRIRLLGGEEPTDCLGLHPRPASEVGLSELQILSASIEDTDHRIDLLDSVTSLFIRLPVLGVVKTSGEVALCPGLCCGHDARIP